MQFSSPSKKQRPSNAELDPTEQHQRCGGAQPPPRELFHKRKWDDVDEDGEEEERDAIEEEELLDSSDDEEEEGLHRSRHHRQQQQTLLDGRRVANERMTRPKADLQSATEENGDKGEAVVLVSFPAETGSASHEAKHHKTVQKKPDIRDIPRARHVLLCFPEAGDVMVAAKIVCKEFWGVRVEVLEEQLELAVSAGTRYWARFTGTVSPVTNIPVLQAIHAC